MPAPPLWWLLWAGNVVLVHIVLICVNVRVAREKSLDTWTWGILSVFLGWIATLMLVMQPNHKK